MNLPRIVSLPEDLKHAHNYEMKIENENNAQVVARANATRDSRN